MIYGYVRVSTKEQNEGRQLEALKEYAKEMNFEYEGIFIDKASGASFDRQQYRSMMKVIRPGDKLVIKELDRLGRNDNYEDIKKELSNFDLLGVKVIILDLPVFNVDDPALNKLLNNLIIELLSYIATKERLKIKVRVKEGLARAKNEGVKLGRPPVKLSKDFQKYYDMWKFEKINATEFAKLLGVSRTTLYKYIKQYEEQ